MSALTIHDMLALFGIEAIPVMNAVDITWQCILPEGKTVKVSERQMNILAEAFAYWIFEPRKHLEEASMLLKGD